MWPPDYDGYKRAFAEEVLDRLMADEEQYRDLILSVMPEVAQMEAFLSLKRHPDCRHCDRWRTGSEPACCSSPS
ncbi:hypothetical protein ACF05W_33880 [Streptomyces lydicus]|uniref:hypothetical protein n=1 Tax=Streptomyces lydicus TaxID=47763 RepID=UPI0036F64FFD